MKLKPIAMLAFTILSLTSLAFASGTTTNKMNPMLADDSSSQSSPAIGSDSDNVGSSQDTQMPSSDDSSGSSDTGTGDDDY